MKIFELEKDSVYNLFETEEAHGSRPIGQVGSPRPAAYACEPVPAARPPTRTAHGQHRRAAASLKLHVLDLGKLRLDKNFMVANTTVATARDPNPRGQVSSIFRSPLITSSIPTATFCSTPAAIPIGAARTVAGRLTDCRSCFLMSAARNACCRRGWT